MANKFSRVVGPAIFVVAFALSYWIVSGLLVKKGPLPALAPSPVEDFGNPGSLAYAEDRYYVRKVLSGLSTDYNNQGRIERGVYLPLTLRNYVNSEPDEAFDYLCSLSREIRSDPDVVEAIGYAMSDLSEAALMELKSYDSGGNPFFEVGVRTAAILGISKSDPYLAWSLCEEFGLLNIAGGAAFLELTRSDPGRAELMLDSLSPPLRQKMEQVYAVGMIKTEPAVAVDYAMALSSVPGSEGVVKSVFQTWAASNPRAAFASAQERRLENGNGVYEGIIRPYAKEDLGEAVARIDDIQAEVNRSELVLAAFQEHMTLPRVDYQNAAAIAEGLSVGPLRRDTLSYTLGAWAEVAPSNAVDWLGNLPLDADVRSAYVRAFSEWIRLDPQSALAHAKQLDGPTGEIFDEVLADLRESSYIPSS